MQEEQAPLSEGPGLDGIAAKLRGRRMVITGGTGFIGRRLIGRLEALGVPATVILRTRHGASGLKARGFAPRVGALGDRRFIEAALDGQDTVINLAYDFRASANDNIRDFNILSDVVDAVGCRIVQLSSIVVYDGWPGANLDEQAQVSLAGATGYRRAKIRMEERILAGRADAAILQPTLVYGPGSSMWTDAPIAALRRGPVVLPEPVGSCEAVFVDDVVQAILRAAISERSGRERYVISSGDARGWDEFYMGYAGLTGSGSVRFEPADALRERAGPFAPGPEAPPGLGAKVSRIGRRLLGRRTFEALVARVGAVKGGGRGDVYPDAFMLDLYLSRGQCDCGKAMRELGYAPQFDLFKGLDATRKYASGAGSDD